MVGIRQLLHRLHTRGLFHLAPGTAPWHSCHNACLHTLGNPAQSTTGGHCLRNSWNDGRGSNVFGVHRPNLRAFYWSPSLSWCMLCRAHNGMGRLHMRPRTSQDCCLCISCFCVIRRCLFWPAGFGGGSERPRCHQLAAPGRAAALRRTPTRRCLRCAYRHKRRKHHTARMQAKGRPSQHRLGPSNNVARLLHCLLHKRPSCCSDERRHVCLHCQRLPSTRVSRPCLRFLHVGIRTSPR